MKKSVWLALAVLLAVVATADARRAPTSAERNTILRTIDRQVFYDVYGKECVAFRLHVSTVDRRWAAINILPARTTCNVQGDVQSVHQIRGQWRKHQMGNGGGCGVPAKVRSDLRLACY